MRIAFCVLVLITALLSELTVPRTAARAQTLCDAPSLAQVATSYRQVEAIPLTPVNILAFGILSRRHSAVLSLPWVNRCSDEPIAIRESYFQLAEYWKEALEAQNEVAVVSAVKRGLTINSPACAAYYAAKARLQIAGSYSIWRHIPLPTVTMPDMERLPEYTHVRSLWQKSADSLHMKLDAVGSPYTGGIINPYDRAIGEASKQLPAGSSCGEPWNIARRGAVSKASLERAMVPHPETQRPTARRNVSDRANLPLQPTVAVTNAWNDTVNGMLLVHDAIILTGITGETSIRASDLRLSMDLANGARKAYVGLEQPAPTYQKISAFGQGMQTVLEVDASSDLGRLGSLRVPANETVSTIVTFEVTDPVADVKANRAVTLR